VFADLDGGGDLDAFIGNGLGNTVYFQNTPTSVVPTAGSSLDVSTNGGTTAIAAATLNLGTSVSAVNDAPVNSVPGAQTTAEDTSLSINGISVADVDGNLANTKLSVTNGTLSVDLTGGATISSGSNASADLTLSGSESQINDALATLSYTPSANYNGSDALTIVSTDSAGTPLSDTDTVDITITAVDDPADISGDLNGTAIETAAIKGQLSATDLEGLSDGTIFSIESTGQSPNGTASIDPVTGSWTYNANSNFFGNDQFTVTVSDDLGGKTTQEIDLNVKTDQIPKAFRDFKEEDIAFLTPKAVSIISARQLRSLRDHTAVRGFSGEQISQLPLATISKMSSWRLKFLSPDAINSLSTDQISSITPKAVRGFKWHQVASMTDQTFAALDKTQLAKLSKQAVAGLNSDHLSTLDADEITVFRPNKIRSFAVDAISGLLPSTLNSLNQRQARKLTNRQLKALSKDQLKNSSDFIDLLSNRQLDVLRLNPNSDRSNDPLKTFDQTSIFDFMPNQEFLT